MLVRFHTPSHGKITYDGRIGVALLKLMGRTGNVPGALDAEHVPAALETLKAGLAMSEADESAESELDDDAEQDRIALRTRAFPLIELLESAVAETDYVSWE